MKIIMFIVNSVLVAALVVSVMLLTVSALPRSPVAFYKVMSGSMEPEIPTGSLVVSMRTDPGDLRKGDIISFPGANFRGGIITHRLHEIRTARGLPSFITKGDANQTPDIDPVAPATVTGRTVLSVPYLGYLLGWIRTPAGFVATVIVPGVYLVVMEILRLKRIVERAAVEKYKKQHMPPVAALLLCVLTAYSIRTGATTAFFSAGSTLAGNIFATGNWTSGDEKKPPEAAVIITENGRGANIHVKNLAGFARCDYTLTYGSDSGTQGLDGSVPVTGPAINRNGLTFGVCSGKNCVYHTGVKNILLTVELSDGNGNIATLTATPK